MRSCDGRGEEIEVGSQVLAIDADTEFVDSPVGPLLVGGTLGESRRVLDRELGDLSAADGDNEAVLNRLLGDENVWRRELGREPEAGVFIGVHRWRRISEIWAEPNPDDIDAAIEIAARLADYVSVLEPLRRA